VEEWGIGRMRTEVLKETPFLVRLEEEEEVEEVDVEEEPREEAELERTRPGRSSSSSPLSFSTERT